MPQQFTYILGGQLEYARIKGCDNLYCKFGFEWGTNWNLIQGTENCITQQAQMSSVSIFGGKEAVNVFNQPIDLAFTSQNVFGWPQIVISVHGPDMLQRDVVRGYGAAYLPRQSGRHTIDIPLFRPQASSFLSSLAGTLNGQLPEFKDIRFLAKSRDRDLVRTVSSGYVRLQLNIIIKDLDKLGYNNGQKRT
ncbi:hypothetical protein MIR68_009128 [Amoeboaphelidium protococcarum]|nr:hypothetical protein MIR68_009128 [Amoeboaphelidium protococcarum]